MARERPTASDVSPDPADRIVPAPLSGARSDGLSHAQAHALLRCTPLTSADFKARATYGGPKHFDIAAPTGVSAGPSSGRAGLGGGRLPGEADRVDS